MERRAEPLERLVEVGLFSIEIADEADAADPFLASPFPQSLELDLSDAMADGMGGAILIQSEGQGPIIGAVEVPVPADPVPAQ